VEVLARILHPDVVLRRCPEKAVLKLALHGGQRCRQRLVPNYFLPFRWERERVRLWREHWTSSLAGAIEEGGVDASQAFTQVFFCGLFFLKAAAVFGGPGRLGVWPLFLADVPVVTQVILWHLRLLADVLGKRKWNWTQ
jgi:hypothetical protein